MTKAGKKKVGRMTRRMCDLPPKLVGEKILMRIPIASLKAVRSTCKLERRTLISIARRQSQVGRMTRAAKKEVGKRMTRICDLPPKLVGEKILTRIPITSLGAVRSTCKLWNALTKEWVLGKAAAARQQFLGFMTMDSKVCSIRFHLRRSKDKEEEEEDLVDLSIKKVDLLNQVEISKVFHCDGLLLCVAKDHSRLVVWNPYLGQTKCVGPRTDFNILDRYALGYDKINCHHKILRFVEITRVPRYEIYDFSSNSWRVLEVTRDWEIDPWAIGGGGGVSVKGNCYFFACENVLDLEADENGEVTDLEDFLLCFDFTTETFGPRLPLPFHSCIDEAVTLSCVRDEQLAVLYQNEGFSEDRFSTVEFWVTTGIEPNSVSWSKFLTVDMRPFTLSGVRFDKCMAASFFIDEEEKVAVVFDLDGYLPTETARCHTAFISGQDGFFKPLSLGVAPDVGEPCPITGRMLTRYCPPLVCSSAFLPSLVQLN